MQVDLHNAKQHYKNIHTDKIKPLATYRYQRLNIRQHSIGRVKFANSIHYPVLATNSYHPMIFAALVTFLRGQRALRRWRE